MNYAPLDWVTFGIWVVVICILAYGIIAIHDIPVEIAKKRKHPHADAIEAAAWVSLFMLHAIWPILWIWAYYYKPGWEKKQKQEREELQHELRELRHRLTFLEQQQMNSGREGEL